MPRSTRTPPAIALIFHAIAATRPGTLEDTTACNIRLTRARDFLMQSAAHDFIELGAFVSAADFETSREGALRAIRGHCGACGLCGKFGLAAP